MKVDMEIAINSRRYYNGTKKTWGELTLDDITKMLMKYNPKKLDIKWKVGLGLEVSGIFDTSLTQDLANNIMADAKPYGVAFSVKIRSCSYTSREMPKLKKVLTFEKVFK